MTDRNRMRLFEFLAAPAHLWLWAVGKLFGWDLTVGPVEEADLDQPLRDVLDPPDGEKRL